MGQSVAESPPPSAAAPAAGGVGHDSLPDPLAGHPLPPAGSAVAAEGQADDLLSQLAGAEIDRMLAEADVEPAALPPSPLAAVAVAEPVVEPVVAVLPAEMPAPPPTIVNPAPVAPAAVEPPPPAAAVDLNAVLAAAAEVPPAQAVPLDALPPDGGRLPLLLLPLELLSAPLDRCPDRVREAIGKVAVVTLVNAVAVIAYVAIFHRHG